MEYLHMYRLGSKVSLRFVSFQYILLQMAKKKNNNNNNNQPGDAFAFFVQN